MAKKVSKKEKISLENIPVTQEVPLIDRGKELPSEISEKKPVRGRKIAQKSNQTKESQLQPAIPDNTEQGKASLTKSRKKESASEPKLRTGNLSPASPLSGKSQPETEVTSDSSPRGIAKQKRSKKSTNETTAAQNEGVKSSSVNVAQQQSEKIVSEVVAVTKSSKNQSVLSNDIQVQRKAKKNEKSHSVREISNTNRSLQEEPIRQHEIVKHTHKDEAIIPKPEVTGAKRNNRAKNRRERHKNEQPREINVSHTIDEQRRNQEQNQTKAVERLTKEVSVVENRNEKRANDKTSTDLNNIHDQVKEKRKRKKKKNKRDISLSRSLDDTQANVEISPKVEPPKTGQQKFQRNEQKQSRSEKIGRGNDAVFRGGKHTIAVLEKPERKPVVLRHPSKKAEKKKVQQTTTTHVNKFEDNQKPDVKSATENTSAELQKDVQVSQVVKNQQKESKHLKKNEQNLVTKEKNETVIGKDVTSEETPKQKQKKQPKNTSRQEQEGKEKTQIEDSSEEESRSVDIVVPVEKKHLQDHNKSYNLIPLPKPESAKRKHNIKHKIPLPLKIGSYDQFAESMIQKVEHYLSVELHIPKGSSLLLAVSGGVDSIVMTDLFCVVAHRLHFDIQLCHINHKLRGKESDEDERSVKGFAKRCGLRIHSAHVHVQEYAKKNRISIETAARILRYNALDKQARSCGAEYVVTAHTADDAAETFLMNLFRGSGVTGLSGIPSERPLSKKINVIRPLLSLRKDEIISYAKSRGLYWREDSSNNSLLFTRNKVRLQLLPQLREMFGVGVVETLNRTASLMQGVDEVMNELLSVFLPHYVQQVESGSYTISLIGLRTQTDFLKGEIFQAVLVHKLNQQNQSMSTIKRITQLIDADVNTIIDVNGQIIAMRDRDAIVLSKRKKQFDYYRGITLGNEIVEQEWILRLSVVHKQPKEWSQNSLVEYFDADLLPKLLTIRSWRDGDKFQPIGMKGHTSVSDYLTNNKTRALDRKKVLVLCAGSEIVWIIGKRMSDKFKVSNTTREFIRAEFIVRSLSDSPDKNDKEKHSS